MLFTNLMLLPTKRHTTLNNQKWLRGLVKVECFIKAGRRVKLVSAVDYESSPDVFRVPLDILDSASWKDSALIYGLDRLTIGVSGKPVPEWDAAAVLKSKVPVKRVAKNLIFRLPKKFVEFYALGKSIVALQLLKMRFFSPLKENYASLHIFPTARRLIKLFYCPHNNF